MAKKITSASIYLNEPCNRCGNKKRIAKTWNETIPTLTGTTVVEYSQIVCTNNVCQAEFDELLLEETKKRTAIRIKKEENQAERKANSLLAQAKVRKTKQQALINKTLLS